MTSCRQDPPGDDPVGDPVVTSYAPEAGRAGSEIAIHGENFGNDIAYVKVWINGIPANVVSVSPTRIYAVVPHAAGSGIIKVSVGDRAFELPDSFTFEYVRNVYTYSGSGANTSVDGALNQASFSRPYWLTYDKKDDALFVLEEGRRIRRIKDGMVETLISLQNPVNNPRSITMSLTSDTLFIGNDNGNNLSNATVAILTRETDFKVQSTYVQSIPDTRHVNYAGIHPDGTLMFYCWPRRLYKWNKTDSRVELLYNLASAPGPTGDFYANFAFSPDGKTMYVVSKYPFIGILKANYNPSIKEIVGGFSHFAGTGGWGAADGMGTAASFDQPAQVTVDQYGRLYIAEKFNHWIRTVLPSGEVMKYAGDGGAGNHGYVNGDQSIAKFDQPEGITIDKDGTIYVADMFNNRIRTIKDE